MFDRTAGTTTDARRTNALLARQLVAKAAQERAIRVGSSSSSNMDVDRATGRPRLSVADFEAAVAYVLYPATGRSGASGGTKRTSAEVLAALDGLVGRHSVKKFMHALSASATVRNARMAAGITVAQEPSRHMVFKGNPGTGKTVVAKMAAEIMRDLGLLKRGQLVQVSRGDLVAGYVGQTAIKTQAVVDSAMGGVLFIDEAYSLVQSSNGMKDMFGEEALTVLLDQMELHRDELVVILAGYEGEMEGLLETNPGLRSRFPNVLSFEDFSVDENAEILASMVTESGYTLPSEGSEGDLALRKAVEKATKFGTGNARTMRNLCEELIRNHSLRVASASVDVGDADDGEIERSTLLEDPAALVQIQLEDIEAAELPFKKKKAQRAVGFM